MRRLSLGLAIATMLVMMPKAVNADDQQIADKIMQGLQEAKQQGQLKGFQVDMKVQDGTVWFSGHVADSKQEETIFNVAQSAQELGLVQIVDNIEVRSATPEAQPAVAQSAPAAQQVPVPAAPSRIAQAAYMPQDEPSAPAPIASAPQAAMPAPHGHAPVPMNGAPMGGAPMMDHPNMPGHAWPAYAAYPNYAGVTYPGQYSASAWPYIGPFYPYPQVPLGWRKVQLEWNDGWWYLDFKSR